MTENVTTNGFPQVNAGGMGEEREPMGSEPGQTGVPEQGAPAVDSALVSALYVALGEQGAASPATLALAARAAPADWRALEGLLSLEREALRAEYGALARAFVSAGMDPAEHLPDLP